AASTEICRCLHHTPAPSARRFLRRRRSKTAGRPTAPGKNDRDRAVRPSRDNRRRSTQPAVPWPGRCLCRRGRETASTPDHLPTPPRQMPPATLRGCRAGSAGCPAVEVGTPCWATWVGEGGVPCGRPPVSAPTGERAALRAQVLKI